MNSYYICVVVKGYVVSSSALHFVLLLVLLVLLVLLPVLPVLLPPLLLVVAFSFSSWSVVRSGFLAGRSSGRVGLLFLLSSLLSTQKRDKGEDFLHVPHYIKKTADITYIHI